MGLLDWLTEGLGGSNVDGSSLPPMPSAEMPPAPPLPPMPVSAMPGAQDDSAPAPPISGALPGGAGGPPVPMPQPRPPMPDPAAIPPNAMPAMMPGQPPGGPVSLAPPPGAPTPLTPPADAGMADAMSSYARAGGTMAPPGGNSGAANSILGNALGLSPQRARTLGNSLAAGLKSVGENYKKPGLAAMSGSAGSAMEGGNKAEDRSASEREKLLNTMLRAQKDGDYAAYTKAQIEYTKVKMASEQQKMADGGASRKMMSNEEKLFKVSSALSNDLQLKAAKENLVNIQKMGDPKETAAAQSAFDKLFETKKKNLEDSLRAGSKDNPYNFNSPDELKKKAKPGDIYVNPADGNLYVYKGPPGLTPQAAPLDDDASKDAQ